MFHKQRSINAPCGRLYLRPVALYFVWIVYILWRIFGFYWDWDKWFSFTINNRCIEVRIKGAYCTTDDETLTCYQVTPTEQRQDTNYRYETKMVKLISVIKTDRQNSLTNVMGWIIPCFLCNFDKWNVYEITFWHRKCSFSFL